MDSSGRKAMQWNQSMAPILPSKLALTTSPVEVCEDSQRMWVQLWADRSGSSRRAIIVTITIMIMRKWNFISLHSSSRRKWPWIKGLLQQLIVLYTEGIGVLWFGSKFFGESGNNCRRKELLRIPWLESFDQKSFNNFKRYFNGQLNSKSDNTISEKITKSLENNNTGETLIS